GRATPEMQSILCLVGEKCRGQEPFPSCLTPLSMIKIGIFLCFPFFSLGSEKGKPFHSPEVRKSGEKTT
ncbi:MAG: hypothetical protein NTX30_07300, partial [Deltaproteobacteria bacterium]|nr:hypothetical protein [Deltaproteobacteria bacterium]